MKIKRMLLSLMTAIAACVVGFLLGRYSAWGPSNFRDPSNTETSRQVERFESLVDRIIAYVQTHDGAIPVDPYRSLVETGTVDSFMEFIYGDMVVHFDILLLPPKISKNLSENAKAPFFWVLMSDIGEIWVCYLDGSWEREVRRNISSGGKLSRLGESQITWQKSFHAAGYPYWISIKEKAEWTESEMGNLRWDCLMKMYVPKRPGQK